MANVEKMTKRQKFELAIELATAQGNEMLVEFFKHEIELLENKKSKGNAKANEKMAGEMELVYNALVAVGRPCTPSELIAETDLAELKNENGIVSTQKVSAMLKKLIAVGKVESFTDKKKTYFKVVG